MKPERIMLAKDACDRQIDFTEMLWSTDPSQWAGFQLERHRIGPRGQLSHFSVPDVVLGVCLQGSAQMQYGGPGGDVRHAVVRPGHFTLLNVGEQQRSIHWVGTRETLYIRVDMPQLARLFPEQADGRCMEVAPQYGIADPNVSRLAGCMYEEARTGKVGGALYAESLSIALGHYLLHRYPGRRSPERCGTTSALSSSMARRITEYIGARIGSDVRVTELADVAGLSPNHFLQIFKNTFGTTPHRYLLQQRIDAAQKLLSRKGCSISHIALDLGFADQSHFTRTFRRLTGTTPKRFRASGC